jgi:HEAT repeat protein
MAALQTQVESLRQLVALSLMNQQSATARLRGVTYTVQMEQPDQQVQQALLRAVNHDPNVNVRLSAVDALEKFAHSSAAIRRALADAIPVQESPLVQIALIELLAQLDEKNAVPELRRLAANEQADESVRQRAQWALQKLGVSQ